MKIAIVGGGISGMVTGYRLHRKHQITLFEANDYIGGHTNTIDVEMGGSQYAVDTGFIVFNERTYPNFIALLDELKVPSQPTRMSFSVTCERTGLEYSGGDLNGLFAQRSNLVNPKFYRLLSELFRFNREGRQLLESDDESETVGQYLQRGRYSKMFIDKYFLPMGSAIWSAPFATFSKFPIRFIAEFYCNHGLLDIVNRPKWHVVCGGSNSYVAPITAGWRENIRLNSPIVEVRRRDNGVWVTPRGQASERFDHVVFACHSDQAMRILGSDMSQLEAEILSAFPYQPNTAILHTQEDLLPKRKRAWACWNYLIPDQNTGEATVTYNMNLLQSIESDKTFCVTLNDTGKIQDENIIRQFQYSHPIFDTRRSQMQRRHAELINHNQTSFCGAYWGNGFHEDGVNSAIAVASQLVDVKSEALVS